MWPPPSQLRIGRIGDGSLEVPEQPAAAREGVDPGAADLADEGAAPGERGGAVHRAERARRVVGADPGLAELAHDPMCAIDEEDAAVVGVGNRDEPARQLVGVVGRVRDSRGWCRACCVPVAPAQPSAREAEDLNGVLVFLVADDRAEAGPEEGIVVELERVDGPARRRVAPEDPLAVVDEQDAVVAAVGDQQQARDQAGGNAHCRGGGNELARAGQALRLLVPAPGERAHDDRHRQ